jgi:hypothetical protein
VLGFHISGTLCVASNRSEAPPKAAKAHKLQNRNFVTNLAVLFITPTTYA